MAYSMVSGWRDSLVNLLAGFGVPGRDKAAIGGSFFTYTPLQQQEPNVIRARQISDRPS